VRALLCRLAGLFAGARREQELEDELRSHLELQIDEYVRAGVPPAEARRRALLRFGGLEAVKERYRDRRGIPFLQSLGRDLRHGARLLARAPGFTLGVVLSLGVGIGGASAIFSVLSALTLRPLPVAAPGDLFHVVTAGWSESPDRQFSFPVFARLRAQTPSGGQLAAISRVARFPIGPDDAPGAVQLVSGDYFTTLGVGASLGRLLSPEDDRIEGGHPVAVVSDAFWRQRLGAAADSVGRRLDINGARFTVVGVARPGFTGVWLESPVQVWIPLAMQGPVHYAQNFSSSNADSRRPFLDQERLRWLDVILRASAQHRPRVLTGLSGAFDAEVAREAGSAPDRVRSLRQRLTLVPLERGFSALRGRFTSPLLALMAMVSLLLLIACANTANLLLARATRRRREIALRLSLGASRGRLIQQLATESLLLALLAGAAGLAAAPFAGELLVRMTTGNFAAPLPFSVAPDGRVLLFATALSLATSLLCGLAPAFRSTRVALATALRSGGRGQPGTGSRPLAVLVVSQVALSLLLVVAAGLCLRSLHDLMSVDLGFERQRLVSLSLVPRLPGAEPPDPGGLQQRLVARAQAVPGVRAAAVALCGLVTNCRMSSNNLSVTGYQPAPDENVSVQFNQVGAGYFAAVGMRLVAGRDFDGRDHHRDAPEVAIVNEAFVRRYLAGRDAVGQRYGGGTPRIEIVGVVQDARTNTVREAPVPTAFHPLAQSTTSFAGALEVRTDLDPRLLIEPLRLALAAEPTLRIASVRTMSEQVSRTLTQERAVAALTAALGLLALGLACFGLYGVMSYAVGSRTAELGVRTALGAPPARLSWMVLGESLRLVLAGLGAGLVLILVVRAPLAALLGGVHLDGGTLALAALALTLAAAVAAYLPARRAARVDPMIALRAE
jgi:predicted permease